MPLPGLSTFLGKRYDVSLVTDEEEDVEGYNPPPADEHSSGEDFSGEGYSAGALPNEIGAEGSEEEESDEEESGGGERSSSSTEVQPSHTSSGQPQTNPFPRPSPASAHNKGTGISKGAGPNVLPKSARRPRNSATYNLKTLSRQAVGYSDYSPKKRHSQFLDPGSRRQSEPPTYNLKELIQRTRGQPKGTQKLINNVAKRPAKGNASVNGQTNSRKKEWPVSDDSDNDGGPSKRQRFNPDTSIADSFASEGLDVADSATQQNLDSASKSAAQRPWTDGAVSSKLQASSELLQYIIPWIQHGGGALDPKGIADDERMAKMLTLPMQRTIEWNNASRNRWSVNSKIDIVALVMQLTGEDSPSPCNRCASDPKYGQWVGCKVMSSKMASEAWRLYGCANCVYHGKQTYCSFKIWSRERATRETVFQENPKEKGRDGDAEDDSSEFPDQSEASVAEITTTKGKNAKSYTSGHPVYQNNNGTNLHAEPTRHQDASLVSAGQVGDMSLRMEPWEKAPGRLRSRNSEALESKLPGIAHIRFRSNAKPPKLTGLQISLSPSHISPMAMRFQSVDRLHSGLKLSDPVIHNNSNPKKTPYACAPSRRGSSPSTWMAKTPSILVRTECFEYCRTRDALSKTRSTTT